MTTRDDVEPIFQKALQLIENKEDVYGDAWKVCGKSVCIPEVFRKANYIRVQWEKDRYTTEKFMEDLLDLVNWAVYSYWHVERETKDDS